MSPALSVMMVVGWLFAGWLGARLIFADIRRLNPGHAADGVDVLFLTLFTAGGLITFWIAVPIALGPRLKGRVPVDWSRVARLWGAK